MFTKGCLKYMRKIATSVLAVGALLGFVTAPSAVKAGDGPGGFPKRQITIIVCFGAGGGSARITNGVGV